MEKQTHNIKKIVIIGPESTGKSTLCEQLAEHYQTIWCPEYAREYLLKNGTDYKFDDLAIIAKGQLALEDKCEDEVSQKLKVKNQKHTEEDSKLLFIDTDMYVMKVWCEFVFGKCHSFIEDEIKKRRYDLYLLCNIDLPWTKDELREYPDEKPRKELYIIYRNLLEQQSTPYAIISGSNGERLNAAIKAVDNIVKEH